MIETLLAYFCEYFFRQCGAVSSSSKDSSMRQVRNKQSRERRTYLFVRPAYLLCQPLADYLRDKTIR